LTAIFFPSSALELPIFLILVALPAELPPLGRRWFSLSAAMLMRLALPVSLIDVLRLPACGMEGQQVRLTLQPRLPAWRRRLPFHLPVRVLRLKPSSSAALLQFERNFEPRAACNQLSL
jgi:hypothetical protein